MAKKSKVATVKKAKKEVVNPFDLRFNKIKHKVVNKKLHSCEYGSNPYRSRSRANDLRKNTLLNEYKNKNKSGILINKREKEQEPEKKSFNKKDAKISIDTSNTNLREKRKSNAEYMIEMFEKKKQCQVQREKLDDLKDKLDEKWSDLKNFIEPMTWKKNDFNTSESKVDNYDLLLNDLLINGGENCVPGGLLSKQNNTSNVEKSKEILVNEKIEKNLSLESKTKTEEFQTKLDFLKTDKNYINVLTELKTLLDNKQINLTMYNSIKISLLDINFYTKPLNAFAIFTLASTVPNLKIPIYFKIIEVFKLSKYNSISQIFYLLCYCNFILKITEKTYFPEVIQTLQNIIILFIKNNNFDSLFLPTYKIQRIKDRNFLCFEKPLEDDQIINEPLIKFISCENLEDQDQNKLKRYIFTETLNVLNHYIDRYRNLESFTAIFYYISKLLPRLSLDYPKFAASIDQIIDKLNLQKPIIQQISLPKPKPKMLPMIEPDFGNFNAENKVKLYQKKLKRETKSAQREIKKDAQFISQIKLKETIEKDKIRKEKVKQLISEINIERSMFKK